MTLVITHETKLSRFHPGTYLEEELDVREIEYREFAEKLNIPFATLINILGAREDIDEQLAEKLQYHLGTSFEYWMNLQKSYNDRRAKEIEREARAS